MKVISILQPWASLIVLGHKRIETRSWNTKYRGELLIHASKSTEFVNLAAHTHFNECMPVMWCDVNGTDICYPIKEKIPLGCIIGKVNLVDVILFDAVRGMIDQNMAAYIGGRKVDFSEKEIAFGDYSPGRFGWLLSDPVLFSNPIPAKGKLGIWNYDILSHEINFQDNGN
jgi:hypothetical protein